MEELPWEKILPFFKNRRWFAQKDENVRYNVVKSSLLYESSSWRVYAVLFKAIGRETILYFVPLIISKSPLNLPYTFQVNGYTIGEADLGEYYIKALYATKNEEIDVVLPEIKEIETVKLLGNGNTTNINTVINDSIVLKTYRIVDRYNPEPEFLTLLNGKTSALPSLKGTVKFDGELVSLATEYIRDAIMASKIFNSALSEYIRFGSYDLTKEIGYLLGRTTAEFHKAILSTPKLSTEPVSDNDIEKWTEMFRKNLEFIEEDIDKARLLKLFESGIKKSRKKMRIHMDYHLEQVLYMPRKKRFYIIDLEGEPQRKGEERKMKYPPERDIATMIRSFDYLCKMNPLYKEKPVIIKEWERYVIKRFITGYESLLPLNREVIIPWIIEKAVLEYLYEKSFRKDYVHIPRSALKEIIKGILPWSGEEMKLVIVVRRDLKMGKGKLAVQVAHAAVQAALSAPTKVLNKWRQEGERKIAVWAKDENELLSIIKKAQNSALPVYVIHDAGRTQIKSGTITCAAIGPAPEWKIDMITGNLKLI